MINKHPTMHQIRRRTHFRKDTNSLQRMNGTRWQDLSKECEKYSTTSNWVSRGIIINLYLVIICVISIGTMYIMGMIEHLNTKVEFWIQMTNVMIYGCNDTKQSMTRFVLSKLAYGWIPSCADVHFILEKATSFVTEITFGLVLSIQAVKYYKPYVWYKARLYVLKKIGNPIH